MTGVAWSGEPPRTRGVPCRGPRKVHTNTASPPQAPPPSPRVCGGALSAGVVGTIHNKGLREDQEESEAERACQPRKVTQGFQGAGTSSRPNWGHKGPQSVPEGRGDAAGEPVATPRAPPGPPVHMENIPVGPPKHMAPPLSLSPPPTQVPPHLSPAFLSHTREGGPRPVRYARAAVQPSLLHTRQHTHHYTRTRAPSQPRQPRALSYTQRLCVTERKREGEAASVEEGALTQQPRLQGQQGPGSRPATSPSHLSLSRLQNREDPVPDPSQAAMGTSN